MKRGWLVVMSLVLVLAMVGLCGCNTGSTSLGESPSEVKVNLNSQQEGIWVSGEGKVTVTPDIATLCLGITAQAASVAEAQSQATEAMNGVMTALTDGGVADKDIQTQHFSIDQVTQWDEEKNEEVVVGYRVTNMVTAKISEIDNAGSIIDAVAAAGGDYTRINSISFSVDDPSAYYEEARQEAMADALAKAEQLAESSGVELGKPTYISEGTVYPVIYREAAMEASPPAPTPISPGEIELTLTVQVVYAILD
jgi:uncharacterized protein YggE